MRDLGQALKSIDRIGASFQYRVRDTVAAALKHLTDRDLVEVQSTTAETIAPGKAVIRVFWRDVTTGEETFSEI
jgi:hypothetical protein